MEINKKVLASVFIISMLAFAMGYGTMSYFNDTETSTGNKFTAGTLDLKVDGQDNPNVVNIILSNMKPGDEYGYYKWVLKNTGTLPGKLSVTFNIISDAENGETEPEAAAEDEPYGYQGARPTLGHPDRGELSEFLKPGVHPDDVFDEAKPYLTILDGNDAEGWWIGEVSKEVDTGGSCGWGPKGWSVPSTVISQWAVGPSPAYAGWSFGLKSWDGKTFTYGTLAPGAEIAFFFKVKLDGNLQAWDGCGWHDIDDNVIQGDSVVFDITFSLVQP
jgi:predicted ribosomally synthesized peptide with SipW-like signal peptide